MSVVACVTDQMKNDMLNGVSFSSHTLKIALYVAANSSLGSTTTVYTATGEVSGTGYSAGGTTLSGFSVSLAGNTAELTFNNPSWPSSTITADTAIIYDASNANHILCILSFTSASSVAGTFTVQMPSGGVLSIA
jgi:hypothetical protein